MNQIPQSTKLERYTAASAYIFDLGYFLSWMSKQESPFIAFHFKQANRLLVILVAGLIVFFLGFIMEEKLTDVFFITGGIVIAVYFVVSLIAGISALKGRMKKIF